MKMNLANIEYDIIYVEEEDKWRIETISKDKFSLPEIKVGNGFLSHLLKDIIMPQVEQLGRAVESTIELTLNYYQGREEKWYLQLSSTSSRVTMEKPSGKIMDVSVTMAVENFLLLLGGMKNASTMFIQQELKMKGDMTKALKIQTIISQQITSLKSKL